MQAMHVRQNQQEKALLCPHPAHGPCGSQREAEPARRRRGVELDARGQAEADKQARHHARQTAQDEHEFRLEGRLPQLLCVRLVQQAAVGPRARMEGRGLGDVGRREQPRSLLGTRLRRRVRFLDT